MRFNGRGFREKKGKEERKSFYAVQAVARADGGG